MTHRYNPIAEKHVPDGLRFDVPAPHAGQIVEVAYAAWPPSRYEAGDGARFKRVHDRGNQRTTYFELEEES